MTVSFTRTKGTAANFLFPLVDRGTEDFENTPVTFVAGDSKISKDEGVFVNTINLPTHIGNGVYTVLLTATEMDADRIGVTIIDQNGAPVSGFSSRIFYLSGPSLGITGRQNLLVSRGFISRNRRFSNQALATVSGVIAKEWEDQVIIIDTGLVTGTTGPTVVIPLFP